MSFTCNDIGSDEVMGCSPGYLHRGGDPEFDRLAAAWPTLPDRVRLSILALLESAHHADHPAVITFPQERPVRKSA